MASGKRTRFPHSHHETFEVFLRTSYIFRILRWLIYDFSVISLQFQGAFFFHARSMEDSWIWCMSHNFGQDSTFKREYSHIGLAESYASASPCYLTDVRIFRKLNCV